MIKIYISPTCVKCKLLKTQMDLAKIKYTETTDYTELPIGMLQLPVLKVDDVFMIYEVASLWVESQMVR